MKTELFQSVLQTEGIERKTFWKRSLWKRWRHDKSRDFPNRVFLKHKSKMTGDCCLLRFLRCRVIGRYLTRFQSEITVFKFPRRCGGGLYTQRFFFIFVSLPICLCQGIQVTATTPSSTAVRLDTGVMALEVSNSAPTSHHLLGQLRRSMWSVIRIERVSVLFV